MNIDSLVAFYVFGHVPALLNWGKSFQFFLCFLVPPDIGINSHLEVLEATRPIGIVHVVERTANQPLTSLINQSNKTWPSDSSSSCRHNLTVSLYLPQRLHSNPPSASLGAVSLLFSFLFFPIIIVASSPDCAVD